MRYRVRKKEFLSPAIPLIDYVILDKLVYLVWDSVFSSSKKKNWMRKCLLILTVWAFLTGIVTEA